MENYVLSKKNVSKISSKASFKFPSSPTKSIDSSLKRASDVHSISNVSSYSRSIQFSEPSIGPNAYRYSSFKHSSYLPTSRYASKHSSFYPNMSNILSSSKPSRYYSKASTTGPSTNSRAISCFSTATVKPSFFSNSLESFSKQSIYAKGSKVYETINLEELKVLGEQTDSALENWDRWLNIHHQQQEVLSTKLNRPAQCMVMNTSSNTLYTNQDKQVISEAADLIHVDKYRGHPNFWKPDDAVENDKLGVYQTIQQKYDRSRQNFHPEPPKTEYVGVPNAILIEKGVSGKPCMKTAREKWELSSDVLAKKLELQQEINLIQEYQPDLSEVAIVGVGYDGPRNISSPKHSRCSTSESSKQVSQVSTKTLDFDTMKVHKTSLVTVVIGDEKMLISSPFWTIYFDDCYVNETYTKFMKINNSEESCLKYCWEIVLPSWLESDLPLRQVKNRKACFYFNKNPGAVLPGDETTISFVFKPSQPGVFSEKWSFIVSLLPDRWETVTVNLQGVAVEKSDYRDSLDKIDAYIEACTRYTIARKAVQEVMDRGRAHLRGQLPYGWNFSEEEIFVFNNPNLFYDNKCVNKLKCLHEKVTEGPWDYSVENLRRDLLNESKNKDLGEEIALLTSTVVQLMKPTPTTAFSSEKHKTVYELLCCFVSKLESDGANLKISLNIPPRLKPIVENESSIDHSRKLTNSFSKLSPRPSEMSKKSSRKSLLRTKHSIKSSKTSFQSNAEDRSTLSGQSESIVSENTTRRKKQEYLDALFVKTYFNLGKTIDNVVAALESFEAWNKKTALSALKEGMIRQTAC